MKGNKVWIGVVELAGFLTGGYYLDVLPSDEQLQLILQHKETTLDIEKQKAIMEAILKEAPSDELLKSESFFDIRQ